MRRYLPIIMLTVGMILALVAVGLSVHVRRSTGIRAGMVPDSLAGFTVTQETHGAEAVAGLKQIHLGDFAVQEAAIVVYGQQNVTLWVAGTGAEANAAGLIRQMETRIAGGNSPFTAENVYNFSGREVYALSGLGQKHFYFQSGQLVVWLSVDPGSAEQALREVMRYYP